MADRVTIQDIADALGVSRNTVSKAINNTGILADSTREKVLKKAVEMGYKQFSYVDPINFTNVKEEKPTKEKGMIALFTTTFLANSHFASLTLDRFQRELSHHGYSMSIHRVLSHEVQNLQLPTSFNKDETAGIICFEMFDYDYCKMITNLEIPVLFVDTPTLGLNPPLKADCLYMDNQSYMGPFVNEMIKRGKSKIGFIGDINHCQSFYERYLGYRNAMFLSNLPCLDEYCFTSGMNKDDYPHYKDYLRECFSSITSLPDVFICANDFVAMDILNIFNEFGISVPKDVYLCGFDDSPESKLISPPLTTIHIHTQIMGLTAANLLLSRIEQPFLNYRAVHTETTIIYRQSTND
ncbi:regulatory protein, LacI [Lachnospiraceae bacterium TWA4]|nr:regulatory protein, LacI [Lachnospiraceae bacterium TWA4]